MKRWKTLLLEVVGVDRVWWGREGPGTNDAADVAESLAAGAVVWREKVNTIADGLQGRMGRLTWPLIRDHVDGCIVVSEQEIVEAMKLMFERMKVGTVLDFCYA